MRDVKTRCQQAGCLLRLSSLLITLHCSLFTPRPAAAIGPSGKFIAAQLIYPGGNWDPYPSALTSLMTALVSRTSVDASLERAEISLRDPALFRYPLLFMMGDQSFPPFGDAEVRALRQYLDAGGILFVDDGFGVENDGFHASFTRLVQQLYPGRKLELMDEDHAVYVAFHLLRRVEGGRRLVKTNLYGVQGEGRSLILYSFNDLAGSWARDDLGNFIYPCFPGGDYQREMGFRMGINVVLYALTLDYKKDLIHQPYILRRQK
ncbi:MAG: DUF4159 domain-containing protein [Nitrospirae bacterium]|nr:DUF4159 domain-containing protein [Nitrospirota bacterium]